MLAAARFRLLVPTLVRPKPPEITPARRTGWALLTVRAPERLIGELELQTAQARRWEQKASELEKDVRKLRESFEDQMKSWQIRLAQLEAREHELETARKQIRQLHAELEQREMSQKKKPASQSSGRERSAFKTDREAPGKDRGRDPRP